MWVLNDGVLCKMTQKNEPNNNNFTVIARHEAI